MPAPAQCPSSGPTTEYSRLVTSIRNNLLNSRPLSAARCPTDRLFDHIEQTDVLLGTSAMGHRDRLLTFVGGDLPAVQRTGVCASPTCMRVAAAERSCP